MTQTEALKLALEALENLEEHLPFDWAFDELQSLAGKDEYRKDLAKARSLIPAIKEALANHIEDNLTMVAQPEQEPVEWGVDWGKDGNSVSIIKRLSDGNIEVLAWEYAPHPPQRTWVGLTDEEVLNFQDIVPNTLSYDLIEFSRAIEAKLRSKNT